MWTAIAFMMVTMMTGSCSSDDVQEPDGPSKEQLKTIELTRSERALVSNSNDFAFNLMRQIRDLTKSQICSPISITFALGMLSNGSSGETQQQINKALGFEEIGADSINIFCFKMLQRASILDKQTKVMIANTIFMNKPYELLPDFVSKAKSFYNAEPQTRDFHDGKTRDIINKWASDHTEKMIKEVLSGDQFNPDAVSFLLNAIYFKGTWQSKFNKQRTKNEVFEHPGNTQETIKRSIMSQKESFLYMENELYQALCLPYGNASYQMTILLPNNLEPGDVQDGKDIDRMLQSLTSETWQKTQQQMRICRVDLKMPRFESDTDVDLIPVMEKLGMTNAFDSHNAEFPLFCKQHTYIELMKQVAKIKLDEEGTEAAAVTVIGMGETANVPGPEFKTFHATHPFIYVISEQATGAILFIGQYTGY